jgi:hypothetical protein
MNDDLKKICNEVVVDVSRYNPGKYVEKLKEKKACNISIRMAGVLSEERAKKLSNICLERYLYTSQLKGRYYHVRQK